MTDLTTYPSRTLGSLGPNLTDPGWPVAQGYQPSVSQLDNWANWLVELVRLLGVDGETAVATVLGQLARMGNADPHKYRWLDHFEFRAAGALDPRWSVVTGAIVTVDQLGGYLEIPLDGGVENLLRMQGFQFYRAALPVIVGRIRWTDVTATCPVTRIGFRNSAGTDGFGVEYAKASSNFFRVYTLIGGAYTYTASTKSPTVDVWSDIRVELTDAPGTQIVRATIDGTEFTSAPSAIAQSPYSPLFTIGSGASAGKKGNVDLLGFEADFSQADA